VARNILLAELTGAKIHCQHLSAGGSVALIRAAKKRGVSISGEACPHHFTLTDAAIGGSDKFWNDDGRTLRSAAETGAELPSWPVYDTNFKMNPKVWPMARLRFFVVTTHRTAIMRRKWNSITRLLALPAWKPNSRCHSCNWFTKSDFHSLN
jgi:hypothetical protein